MDNREESDKCYPACGLRPHAIDGVAVEYSPFVRLLPQIVPTNKGIKILARDRSTLMWWLGEME